MMKSKEIRQKKCWCDIKSFEVIQVFVKESLKLTWSMVLQIPTVELKVSDIWKGEETQELFVGSAAPGKVGCKIQSVFPMMCSGSDVYQKEKVFAS